MLGRWKWKLKKLCYKTARYKNIAKRKWKIAKRQIIEKKENGTRFLVR